MNKKIIKLEDFNELQRVIITRDTLFDARNALYSYQMIFDVNEFKEKEEDWQIAMEIINNFITESLEELKEMVE